MNKCTAITNHKAMACSMPDHTKEIEKILKKDIFGRYILKNKFQLYSMDVSISGFNPDGDTVKSFFEFRYKVKYIMHNGFIQTYCFNV